MIFGFLKLIDVSKLYTINELIDRLTLQVFEIEDLEQALPKGFE
jgi:hypothetical protein